GVLIHQNQPVGIFHEHVKTVEHADDLKLLITSRFDWRLKVGAVDLNRLRKVQWIARACLVRRGKGGGTGSVPSHYLGRHGGRPSIRRSGSRLSASSGSPCSYWNRGAKFSLPLNATALERALHCLDNCLANSGGIAKTNFAFRRMDVDVYFPWIQINEQESNWKLSAHKSGVIAFAQGSGEDSALNRPSIN